MQRLVRSWLLTGAVCVAAYLLLVTWFYLPRYSGFTIGWRLSSWWESGGFCSLTFIVVGYLLLQTALRGSLTPGLLSKEGLFLALLPFLFLGDCAGQAYQGARAIGVLGESTEREVRTIDKYASPVNPGDLRLIVRDRQWKILEWELRNGRVVYGFEVPVSKATYEGHLVGSRISVVELPGEPYPFHRLTEDARAQYKGGMIFSICWAVAAAFGLFMAHRAFTRLSRQPHQVAGSRV